MPDTGVRAGETAATVPLSGAPAGWSVDGRHLACIEPSSHTASSKAAVAGGIVLPHPNCPGQACCQEANRALPLLRATHSMQENKPQLVVCTFQGRHLVANHSCQQDLHYPLGISWGLCTPDAEHSCSLISVTFADPSRSEMMRYWYESPMSP